jgi:hypothetical protein
MRQIQSAGFGEVISTVSCGGQPVPLVVIEVTKSSNKAGIDATIILKSIILITLNYRMLFLCK